MSYYDWILTTHTPIRRVLSIFIPVEQTHTFLKIKHKLLAAIKIDNICNIRILRIMSCLSLVWICFVSLSIFSVSTYGIDDKCAACNAIAEELERGLLNEKPRNHLDMRHRLDSKGQREGKLIDYRVSELRVVELLDGLCDKMQDYTIEKVDPRRQVWIKVSNWDSIETTDRQEAKAYSKDISTFCGRLLEQTEDELSDTIKKGSVKPGEVSKVLCHDLASHCRHASGHRKGNYDNDEDEEEAKDSEL